MQQPSYFSSLQQPASPLAFICTAFCGAGGKTHRKLLAKRFQEGEYLPIKGTEADLRLMLLPFHGECHLLIFLLPVAVHALKYAHAHHPHQYEGSSVADKGQGQTGHRGKTDTHTDIYVSMAKAHGSYPNSDHAPERRCFESCSEDGIEQDNVDSNQQQTAHEAGFFSNNRKDKVII